MGRKRKGVKVRGDGVGRGWGVMRGRRSVEEVERGERRGGEGD